MYRSTSTFNMLDPATFQPKIVSIYWYDEPTPQDVARQVELSVPRIRTLKVMDTKIERVTEQQITDTGDDV